MKATHPLILVLWGQGFDEVAASIFVGELRRLGQRVKLVGLNGQHTTGQHGVTFVPDLSLGQALQLAGRANHQIHCLIIPAPWVALQQFSYDPRLAELLGLAMSHAALVVVGALPGAEMQAHANALEQMALTHLLQYPPHDALVPYVQATLLPRLLARGN